MFQKHGQASLVFHDVIFVILDISQYFSVFLSVFQ